MSKRTPEMCKRISEATKAAMYRPDVQAKIRKPRSEAGAAVCRENFAKGTQKMIELRKGKTLDQFLTPKQVITMSGVLTRGRLGRIGTHHSKETIELIRKRRFEQVISNNNTIPEQIIEGILVRNNISYRKQWNVDYKMIVDFYLPDHSTMIFADGDFWHCHKRFGFTDDQVVHHGKTKKEIVEKDDYQNEYLVQKGYRVLRFWEQDLKNKESEVEQEIIKEIHNEGESKVVRIEPLTSLYAGITSKDKSPKAEQSFVHGVNQQATCESRESSETTREELAIAS